MQFTLSDKMCEIWLGLTSPKTLQTNTEIEICYFIFLFSLTVKLYSEYRSRVPAGKLYLQENNAFGLKWRTWLLPGKYFQPQHTLLDWNDAFGFWQANTFSHKTRFWIEVTPLAFTHFSSYRHITTGLFIIHMKKPQSQLSNYKHCHLKIVI